MSVIQGKVAAQPSRAVHFSEEVCTCTLLRTKDFHYGKRIHAFSSAAWLLQRNTVAEGALAAAGFTAPEIEVDLLDLRHPPRQGDLAPG